MLFILSDDLLPFCSNLKGDTIGNLQSLLSDARNGLHAIIGKPSIFSTLARNASLSEPQRAMAKALHNKASQFKEIEDQIQYRVIVTTPRESNLPQKVEPTSWEISVNNLHLYLGRPLVILGENLKDANFYLLAGKHHKIYNRTRGLEINAEPRGGGGTQIVAELNSTLARGIPILAITDGDQRFPAAGPSHTSKLCNCAVTDGAGLGIHRALPVRAIENLIPASLLNITDVADVADKCKTIFQLDESKATDTPNPSKFANFKNPLSLEKIFSLEDNDERRYWLAVATTVKDVRPLPFESCLDQSACQRSPCACAIHDGLSNGILRSVLERVYQMSPRVSAEHFSKNEVWKGIGADVFQMGVAFPRTVT